MILAPLWHAHITRLSTMPHMQHLANPANSKPEACAKGNKKASPYRLQVPSLLLLRVAIRTSRENVTPRHETLMPDKQPTPCTLILTICVPRGQCPDVYMYTDLSRGPCAGAPYPFRGGEYNDLTCLLLVVNIL